MQRIRVLVAIPALALSLALVAGAVVAQDDDDVMSPMETPTAQTGGLAAIGLVFVDSTGSGDAIVGATSPAAGSVELHASTVGDDGIISMSPVDAIPIPAGGETLLEPGGYHLMLIDPVDDVAAGDAVDFELELEVAGTIQTSAVVVLLEGAVLAPPPEPVADLPTSFQVEAYDNFYVPDTLEAPANTEIKVTLLNYGFLPHNIAFYTDDTASQLLADGSLTSVIDPETEAIVRFTTPGPGEYFILCVIHPEMTGTLVVR